MTASTNLAGGTAPITYELNSKPAGFTAGSQYTWTAGTGALTFNSTGVALGDYAFVIRATNSVGHADYTWTVTVTAPPPALAVDGYLSAMSTETVCGVAGVPGRIYYLGENLTANVTVTPPSGFAVSTSSNGTYQTSAMTLTKAVVEAGGNIFVMLTNSVPGEFSGNVSFSGGGLESPETVAVSGEVKLATPVVTVQSGANSQLHLGWEAVTAATNYIVTVCRLDDPAPGGAGRGWGGWDSRDEGDGWETGGEAGEETGDGRRETGARALSGYTGTGTFTEITDVDDFTDDGYYVLVNSNNVAMNSTISSSKFQSSAVGFSGTTLTNPPVEAVWRAIEYEDGSFALQNVSTETAANGTSSSGTGVSLVATNNMTTRSYWWPSCNGTTWQFLCDGAQTRALFASSDVWGNYGTNNTAKPYSRPRVFKLDGGGGGDNCNTYTTAGTNLVLSAPDVAAGTNYSWSVRAQYSATAVSDATNGETRVMASTPTLTVSDSTVTAPGATYPNAGNSTSFTVRGSDLTGDVSVALGGDSSDFQWKVGDGSWGNSITLPNVSGGTLALTTISVRLKAEARGGSKSATVTFSGGGLTSNVGVTVNGTVSAVAPTVGTPTCTDVTVTGATLGGTVSSDGGTNVTAWGVVFSAASVNADPTVGGTGCTNVTASAPGTGAFTVAVSGLTANTAYKWKAYAVNSAGTGYTVVQTVTTLAPTLSVSSGSVTGMEGVQYQDGTAVDLSVGGTNLLGNVTVAVTNGPFEVSTDGGLTWGTEKVIAASDGVVDAATVKVRIVSGSLTGPVNGWLSVTSPSASPVEVSLAGSVAGATVDTGSWLGDSRLVLNGTWYKGTATEGPDPACPGSLGYLTALTLGGHVQTYGQHDGETYPAYMTYSIDGGAETTVALIWYKYGPDNNWFGMGGVAEQGQHVQTATELDLSGLAGGEHTLTVYFWQPTTVGSGTLYDASSTRRNFNITFVTPAWSGPNAVYWRGEAVDGHFVRQDGDGNHDPWWYRITDTVGFHNPNMTDYGPNTVIFDNTNQTAMTNDVASTVASLSYTTNSSVARTNAGTATLTVNSAITNVGALVMFKIPLTLGGNVKVHNTKTTYFNGTVSGSGKTLTKTGSGTLNLGAAVTVDTLAVNAGYVQLNTAGPLSGNMTLASGATFRSYPSSASTTVNYAGTISGAGKIQTRKGTTKLSGANTYSGGTTIWTGTLEANHATALGTGAVTVRTNATLKVGVASVSVASVNFNEANTTLSTGTGKVLASTGNAVIKKVTFDAGNYSGDDTQWTIVTSSSGTITQDGELTVVNGPATGTFVLELSGDSKTLYVTYHKPPAAPSLTVSTVAGNGGQLSGTATPPAGAGVVVVRLTASEFGSPTGTTLPSVGTTGWAGGTVVSVSSGAFTDSGLTGCTTYSYKAWSLKNGLWSESGTTGSAETDTPAAPTLNTLASVTYQGFTASWNEVPGASTYRMDITKGGGSTGLEASREFADLATNILNGTSETVASLAWSKESAANAPAWYSEGVRMYAVGTGLGGSCTITPASDVTITKVKLTSSKTQNLNYYVNGGSMQTATSWSSNTMTFSGLEITSSGSFKFQNASTTTGTSGQLRITKIEIEYSTGGGGSIAVAGWTDKDVGSIMTTANGVVSVAVTGLEEETTYSVVVRSEGATPTCKSVDSNSESATTLLNPSVTGVTISDADGAGEASAVAAGNVAAGQTVLVQGSKLVLAAGSVNPTLAGVTFTTAGTAGTGDVDSYRVKVTTDATWAAGDTGLKGTVSCAGAATSHTVTFDSAQTLTAGQTYYVWIEAVTAAEASGGATVGVAALTTDAFATTGARKTGSTTATGLQTIGNLTAFSASTGTTAGGQVDLTWTAGAGGSVLVRWSDVSLEAIPAPGMAWANEATGLTGGTHTVTGLTGCQAYYFKAWEVVGGVACGTALTNSASASAPAAPTGLGHGTPTAHEATLTWTAGAGAASHVIDLWHYEGGSGGGGISGIEGIYEMITSTNELADGNYVFVETRIGTGAMNNVNTSSRLYPVSVAAQLSGEGNSILTLTNAVSDSNIVWKLAYDSTAGNWTIQSVGNSQYVSWASGNAVKLEDSVTDNYDHWTLVFTNGCVKPTNVGDTSRVLQFNNSSGNDFFACYTSAQAALKLYKQTGGGGSGGTKVDDIIGGVVQDGCTVVTTNGATSVGLGRLTDGTTYYWTVKALGEGGCAGGVSGQDSFTTSELLGAPTITPLTNGVEQISGAVTGVAAGATVRLTRFESEALAGTGTAWGLSGTVVEGVTETPPGSGTWTFTDTGLVGCKTYWYKAWQWQEFDGERATSGASAVQSAKTDLGTPVVTAVGAGTQMTLSWPAVPGASSYSVLVSSDDSFDEGSGTGEAVLTDDFEWITAKHDASITNTLKGRGWASDFVYAGVWTNNGTAVKCARVGKSGAPGWIITPEIDAMANGGTLTFKLMQYSDDTGTVSVELSTDGSTWQSLGYDAIAPTTNWTEYTVALPASKTAGDSFFLSWETSTKRAYLDDISVAPNAGSGGTIVHTATVTSSPWETTAVNLEVGHTYYYRVTATNDEGGCSAMAEGSETTQDAAVIDVQPKHYNFRTVTKNEGGKTATFTVRNQGNIALTFTSAGLVQDGDAYRITSPANPSAPIAAGGIQTYTVLFNPTNSGQRLATLQFLCNAVNAEEVEGETYRKLEIPLSGTCYDPATADPEVLWLSVTDGLGVVNTVWDESMANSASQPTLAVTAYHFNGLDEGSARWTLYDAETNVVLADQAFTNMSPASYDGRVCTRFTAAIPALGAANTYRGKYLVGVTLKDSTRTYTTTTNEIVPIEREWLLDDFMRADAVGSGGGALGNGWTARASSGSTPSSAAIRNASLELYGPGGERSGTQGRVAAGRDMSDERYPKEWKEFTGQGSWGFHFKTGANTASWNDGSTAGAFVLGATHVAWFTTEASQKGVVVMFTNDCVRLARFEKSLLQSGTIADLTTAAWTNGTQGKWLAVRVDYLPGREAVDEDESDDGEAHAGVPAKMRLYVKEVEGPGGNPVEECGEADLVETVEVGDAVDGNLKYGGMVWNHGTAQLSETTGGTFDDIYVPHLEGQGEPMEFHVIDEDVEGPTFDSFNVGGAVAAATAASEGLAVTGMVHDASGVWATGEKAPTWTLYVDGEEKSHGPLAVSVGGADAVDGEAADAGLSGTIASTNFNAAWRTTNCVVVVRAWDCDRDRAEGDSLEGTATYRFTLCDTTPVAPAWATVEADGQEMVVVRWSGTGANYVVLRSTTPFGEDALEGFQGTTNELAAGWSFAGVGEAAYIGSGSVVYQSGGSTRDAGWRGAEIVVAPGSSNYFAVAGLSGSGGAGSTGFFFSKPVFPKQHATDGSGVPTAGTNPTNAWPTATKKYANGEGVDSFEYRTTPTDPRDEDPAGKAVLFSTETNQTGSGWGGAWTGDTGKWKIHDGNLPVGDTDYPDPVGNKLYWVDDSANNTANSARLTRMLDHEVSGDFFVSAIINYQYGGPGKFLNVALIGDCTDSGGTSREGVELASFGKQGDKGTGDWANRAKIWVSGYYDGEEHLFSETTGGDGDYYLKSEQEEANSDYVIVGQVSPTAGVVRMWAYYAAPGGGASTEIPQIWDATNGVSARTNAIADWSSAGLTRISKVTGIRVQAGCIGESDSGGNPVGCIGAVYVDEVRFSTSWENLFSFDKPEVIDYSFGANCGTNEDETIIWRMSDGELAHAEVAWTNLLFDLYHRTGVASASFTVMDEDGNVVLKNALTNGLAGTTDASVALQLGTNAYWSSPVTNAAISTNLITLTNEYTVQVTLQSMGGRSNTVTSSTGGGGGGATDLFIGEFGEGSGSGEKYIEIYNGTSRDIDLHDYFVARTYPKTSSMYGGDLSWTNNYSNTLWYKTERISATTRIIPKRTTLVLLSNLAEAGFVDALAGVETIKMGTDVLNSGGQSVIALFRAEDIAEVNGSGVTVYNPTNKPWLDACGLSLSDQHFIQSRLEDVKTLPRSSPLVLDPAEWDYRPWRATTNDVGFTNVTATAGVYDRNVGLAGNLTFQVFDDDQAPPEVGGASGVYVGGVKKEPVEGSKVFTQTGWSFTRQGSAGTNTAAYTEEEWNAILAPSDDSRSTNNAHVTWDPRLGDREMVRPGSGQSGVEFNGQGQVARGELYVKCNRGFDSGDTVWIAFDLDMESMSQRTVAFGYKGTSTGFGEGWVEWSETGMDGSWEHPEEWDNLALPGNDTYTEWAGDIEAAGIPAAAGHLHFRVCLRGYKQGGGSFYLDNFRVEGAPQEVVVTDAEVCGSLVQFKANVHDESGLQAGVTGTGNNVLTNGARFEWGLTNMYLHRDVGGLENSADRAGTNGVANVDADGKAGRGTNSWITWSAYTNGVIASNGLGKTLAQTWFTNSAAGLTQLKMTVADADDDRSGDATERVADFGMLAVVDDDSEVPMLELTSMKPRKGTSLVRWLTKQAHSTAPTHVADGLAVANLDCQAGVGGRVTTPKTVLYSAEAGTYGLKQSGWMYNTKYWRITLTAAQAVTVTNIQFQSKGSSAMAPATFTVSLVANPGATNEAETAKGPFEIATGGAWSESEAGTWMPASTGDDKLDLDIPADTPCELRITGTGVTATNFAAMNATWTIFDLQILGGADEDAVDESEAYTYLTDHSLATGTNAALQGYLWDPGSGLAWTDGANRLAYNPRFVMTKGVKTPISGELAFAGASAGTTGRRDGATYSTNNLTDGGAREKTAFKAELPLAFSYTNLDLTDYGGTIYAGDADDDRRDGDERVDQASIEDEFAFGVVDQDLVGPSAPADVAVNGVAVPVGGWDRETAPWQNTTEFLVTFSEAFDVAPSVDQLVGAVVSVTNDGVVTTTDWSGWPASNGIERVSSRRKAAFQTGTTGVGEYRVSLSTNAEALADAPAFSVAVTNGAIANYGFERFEGDIGWVVATNLDGITGSVAHEGTNSLSVGKSSGRARHAQQVIACEMGGAATVTVGGTLWYCKNGNSSEARIHIEAFSDEAMTVPVTGGVGTDPNYGEGVAKDVWTQATVAPQVFTPEAGTARIYLRVMLYATSAACYFDDVRLSVRVGAAPAEGTVDRATMRYEADETAQGLNEKYLFAVDGDNDRKGDRSMGKTAVFYAAFDCTPPTPVAMDHGTGASTESVDDPTTQMRLTWNASNVGPDDNRPGAGGAFLNTNYAAIPAATRSAATDKASVLSPWKTYKVYYSEYDTEKVDQSMATEGQTVTNYFFQTFLKEGALGDGKQGEGKGRYTEWASVTADSEIEDTTATTDYDGLRNASTGSVTLYDLENDLEYVFVMVGVDAAGNEGPATTTSWATNNTIKFALTQGGVWPSADINAMLPAAGSTSLTHIGMARIADTNAKPRGAVLYWKAAGMTVNTNTDQLEGEVKKDYDLIFRDAGSFNETGREQWSPAASGENSGTSKTNWNYQTDGLEGISRKNLRFYRASYHNRWRDTNTTTGAKQTPLASEDVYSMNRVALLAGENLVGLQGLPWTNTLAGAFGTNWPAGIAAGRGVKVEFFDENGNSDTNELYWLCSAGMKWMKGSEDYSTRELPASFFARGFSITLPDDLAESGFQEFTRSVTVRRTNDQGKVEATTAQVGGMWWHPMQQVPTNAPRAWNPQLEGWRDSDGNLSADTNIKPSTAYFHGDTDNTQVDTTRFSVEVTYGGRTDVLVSNAVTQVVTNGGVESNVVTYVVRTNNIPDPRLTLVNLNLPVAVHVSKLGLIQTNENGTWTSGLLPGNGSTIGDVIYTYDNETKKVRDNSLMYYSLKDKKWMNSSGSGLTLYPNDAIIIKSMGERTAGPTTNSTWPAPYSTWIWTYSPEDFYELPTRHMGR